MSSKTRSLKRANKTKALAVVNDTQLTDKPVVSEIIGRTATLFPRYPIAHWQTTDWTRPDYVFWSRLARGKELGYELGALFAKRIVEIDAEWTLGRGVGIKSENTDVDERVADFIEDNLDTLMTWRKDSSKLGDAYIIVNADASLSMASPETCEIITDKLDYTHVIAYKFTTVMDTATVIDEYREDGRTVTFQSTTGTNLFGTRSVVQEQSFNFANVTNGVIPVIHLPNDRETNEIYGHPIYEALLTLFAGYDDVMKNSLDGVKIMGRPIPVAEGLTDPQLAMEQNSTRTETVTDKDGNEHTVPVVDFEDLTMLWLGEGGTFKFAAPGSFSADSVAMLKKLFYLMLEHTGIPEWTWGGAVASSKASVEAQMPAFIRYLEGRRVATHKGIRKLVDLWLATKRLTEMIPAIDSFELVWPELETRFEDIHLNKANSAFDRGVLTNAEYLRQLELVDDPEAEAEAAQEEQQTQEEMVSAAVDNEILQIQKQAKQQAVLANAQGA